MVVYLYYRKSYSEIMTSREFWYDKRVVAFTPEHIIVAEHLKGNLHGSMIYYNKFTGKIVEKSKYVDNILVDTIPHRCAMYVLNG